ncbi:hypothetical protein ADUPG1_004068, partial [Aduncisulcus paluster]
MVECRKAGDTEPCHYQRNPSQGRNGPEQVQEAVEKFKYHPIISHNYP